MSELKQDNQKQTNTGNDSEGKQRPENFQYLEAETAAIISM